MQIKQKRRFTRFSTSKQQKNVDLSKKSVRITNINSKYIYRKRVKWSLLKKTNKKCPTIKIPFTADHAKMICIKS